MRPWRSFGFFFPGAVWGLAALGTALVWSHYVTHDSSWSIDCPETAEYYRYMGADVLLINWFFLVPGAVLSPILAAMAVGRMKREGTRPDASRRIWWTGSSHAVKHHLLLLYFLGLGLLFGSVPYGPIWKSGYGRMVLLWSGIAGLLQLLLSIGVLLPLWTLLLYSLHAGWKRVTLCGAVLLFLVYSVVCFWLEYYLWVDPVARYPLLVCIIACIVCLVALLMFLLVRFGKAEIPRDTGGIPARSTGGQ